MVILNYKICNMFSISQSCFYNQVILSFKDKFLPTLTIQQQKVVLAVSLIFSCLAAFFAIWYYCFKDKNLNHPTRKPDLNNDKPIDSPHVKETRFENNIFYEIYEGEFESGCFRGKIIYSEDNVFEGEFENYELKN